MKRYVPIMAALCAAYALNRFVLIPVTGWRLLAWYGADALAGGLILCVLNAALAAAGKRPFVKIVPASAFLLGCGLFWEYVTPLYLSRSVSDPWDVAAVWLGSMAVLWRIKKRAKEK